MSVATDKMKMQNSELLTQAKSFTNFFRRFEKAEQVIGEVVALEGSIATLKQTQGVLMSACDKLREDKQKLERELETTSNDFVDKYKAIENAHHENVAALAEQLASEQTKTNDLVSELTATRVAAQAEHDQAIEEMTVKKESLENSVRVLEAELGALKARAENL